MTTEEDDWEDCNLNIFSDEVHKKEKEWKKAIQTALSGRDQQIASLKQQVTDFQKQLENTLQLLLTKEREITVLENNIRELRLSFENEKRESENSAKHLISDFTAKMKEKEVHIDNLKENFLRAQTESREQHAIAIRQLIKEYTSQVEIFESELQQARNVEHELKAEIEKIMHSLDEKVSEIESKENKIFHLENEMKEVQKKLSKSYDDEAKFVQKLKANENLIRELKRKNDNLQIDNEKIKNQIVEKIIEVNENVKCESDKTIEIHNDISIVKDLFVELNKENSFMKNILMKMSNDFIPQYESVGVQVNINLTDICFEDTIVLLKRRIWELTENEINLINELKKCQASLESTLNQNLLLREVIKSMKKEKEVLLKEKQIEEDEQRIKRLEDSVRILKTQMTRENCGDGIWVVLNEMKDDLKGLKGKSWHKVTKVNPVLQEVTDTGNTASQQCTMPLQPTVIPCSVNRNLPLQVPKDEENVIKNRQRRANHCVSISN